MNDDTATAAARVCCAELTLVYFWIQLASWSGNCPRHTLRAVQHPPLHVPIQVLITEF